MKPRNDDDVRDLLQKLRAEGVLTFTADIYNRPLGRGMCFRFPSGDLGGIDVEDVIPEGDFEIVMTVRKLSVCRVSPQEGKYD